MIAFDKDTLYPIPCSDLESSFCREHEVKYYLLIEPCGFSMLPMALVRSTSWEAAFEEATDLLQPLSQDEVYAAYVNPKTKDVFLTPEEFSGYMAERDQPGFDWPDLAEGYQHTSSGGHIVALDPMATLQSHTVKGLLEKHDIVVRLDPDDMHCDDESEDGGLSEEEMCSLYGEDCEERVVFRIARLRKQYGTYCIQGWEGVLGSNPLTFPSRQAAELYEIRAVHSPLDSDESLIIVKVTNGTPDWDELKTLRESLI